MDTNLESSVLSHEPYPQFISDLNFQFEFLKVKPALAGVAQLERLPYTRRLWVRFPFRAHTQVASLIPSWARTGSKSKARI